MSKFNFDEMMKLHQEDPEMFELKRIELINAVINRSSGPQREALKHLQYQLDMLRENNPSKFILNCFVEMKYNFRLSSILWTNAAEKLKEIDKI